MQRPAQGPTWRFQRDFASTVISAAIGAVGNDQYSYLLYTRVTKGHEPLSSIEAEMMTTTLLGFLMIEIVTRYAPPKNQVPIVEASNPRIRRLRVRV